MAVFATGRSRTVTFALTANEILGPAALPFMALHRDTGVASGWGFSLDVTFNITGKGIDVDGGYGGPGHRWRVVITYTLTANVVWPGGSDTLIGTGGWTSGYVITTTDPTTLGPSPGVVTEASSEAEASLTAECLLTEYCDTTNLTQALHVKEQYTSVNGDASAEGTAEANYSLTIAEGTIFDEDFTVSASDSLSFSEGVGGYLTITSGYRHSIVLSAAGSIDASFSASGPGLSYSDNDVSGTIGGATLSGDTNAPSLSQATANRVAVATITGCPDWRFQADFKHYDYETGDELTPTPDMNHYAGTEFVSTSGDGTLEYPAAGAITNYCRAQLTDGVTSGDTVDRRRDIWVTNAAETVSANHLRMDEAWADDFGTYLESANFGGIGKWCDVHASPEFDLATLRIDATHRFTIFDSLAYWSAPAVMDSGLLKFPAGGFPTFATSYELKHFAYRYARIRVKASEAGATFFMRWTISVGAFLKYYVWNFVIDAADTWETKEIDLAMPDEITDPFNALRYIIHPNDFNPSGVPLIEIVKQADTDFWFDYLEGYHKTGDRIPLLLTGPHMTSQSDTGLEDLDTCPAAPDPSNGGIGGGNTFRLIVNGVRGLLFNSASAGTIEDVWATYATRYDDAANDTGIHITAATPSIWMDVTKDPSGHLARAVPLWRELTAGVPLTLRACAHQFLFGYPGMGDFKAGTYAAALTWIGEKYWNGEAQGNVFKGVAPWPGTPISLRDDDTEAEIDADTADADGFWRTFGKYGVIFPYSNYPAGSTCASRKQWSGSTDNPTYTTLGLTLNAYWMQSERLARGDADHYVLSGAYRRHFVILDRGAAWYELPGRYGYGSPDLLEMVAPVILRAYRDGEGVAVARAARQAATWTASVVAATGAVASSRPTLARDANDRTLCLYHDAANLTHVLLSADWGATWTERSTQAGRRFPRAVFLERRLIVCALDGTTLRFYRSDDFGTTLTEIGNLTGIPDQLVSFRAWRGRLHLFYADGGALLHRYSKPEQAGSAWSSPFTVIASGVVVGTMSATIGEGQGLLAWFEADNEPQTRVTDETYETINRTGANPDAMTGTGGLVLDYETHPLGLLIDRSGNYLVAGPVTETSDPETNDGDLITAYSRDDATTWKMAT